MRFFPTRRLLGLVLGGLALTVMGAFVPGMEAFVLVYNFILILLVIVGRAAVCPAKDLALTRQMDAVLSVRAENRIEVTLTNHSRKRVRGRMRDECPDTFRSGRREGRFNLGAGQSARLHYSAYPQARGTEVFLGTWVRLTDPFGLTETEYVLGADDEIQVYPNLKAVQEFDLLNQRGRLAMIGIRRTRYRGIGTEFESLRSYQPDDDFRLIDWKSTARRGELVVKEYEVEKNQPVFIVIDIGRGMLAEAEGVSKLDHVLDAALLLMHAVERAGDQVGLMVYADRVLQYIPPKRGSAQIASILRAIHDLAAMPVESNHRVAFHTLAARWKRRALLVLFTEVESPEEAGPLLAAIEPQRHRHLWFVARVKDPGLAEQIQRSITTSDEYDRRAAAVWYEGKRDAAVRMINQRLPSHVDAEPKDLAAALVNTYIDIKLRTAL